MISLPSPEGTCVRALCSDFSNAYRTRHARRRCFVRGAPKGGGKCFDLRRKLGGENLCVSVGV